MATAAELFSLRDVGRLFEIPESRLRYWAQTGFVTPSVREGGRRFYNFRDLIAIKVANGLLRAGLPLQRVRRSLEALGAKLPSVDRPLEQLRIRCDHDRVMVDDGSTTFDALTGQLVIDFAIAGLRDEARRVLSLPWTEPGSGRDDHTRSAYEWFLEACERERTWDGRAAEGPEIAAAEHAYRRALELDPDFAAAWTNLGSLLATRGETERARDAFDEALRRDPYLHEAQLNLAELALRDGDHEIAISGFRQVLRIAPECADAHYGLARALLGVGGRGQALAHLERFCAAVDAMPDEDRDPSLLQRRQAARAMVQSLRGATK